MQFTISRAQLTSSLVSASKDSTRLALNFLRIEPGRLISCDGYRLLIMPIECADDAETPPIALPFDEATRLAKIMKAGSRATIEATEGATSASVAIDGRPCGSLDLGHDPAAFPDYRQVIPKEAATATARLSAVYLRDLCNAAIELNKGVKGKNAPSVLIEIIDDLSLVRISVTNSAGEQTASGVIMPMRR